MKLTEKVLMYPILSERAIQLVQKNNTIVFIVSPRATKQQIKQEIENEFKVKVASVRTAISLDGTKKAYIKIKEGKAEEIAAKYGLI